MGSTSGSVSGSTSGSRVGPLRLVRGCLAGACFEFEFEFRFRVSEVCYGFAGGMSATVPIGSTPHSVKCVSIRFAGFR